MYRSEVHLLFVVASTVLFGTIGCQGNGKPLFSNPFSASGRVPPPATRSLGPGSAQPYYPGDPVPVLQGNTAPMGSPLVSTAPVRPAVTPPVAALNTPQIQTVSLVPGGTTGFVRAAPDSRFTSPAPPAVAGSPALQSNSPSRQTLASPGGNYVSPAAWRSPGLSAMPGGSPPPAVVGQPAPQTAPRIRLPGTPYGSSAPTGQQVPIQQVPIQRASFVTTNPAVAGNPSPAIPQAAGASPRPALPATRRPPTIAHGWQTPSPYATR
jgi:hypothetical protein